MSKPHWANGQGLDRELRTSLDWWMFGANLWHWSHFFTYSYASFYMFGHQYPWVRALWDKDLPPMWLPQIPLCSSSRSSSDALGCMHSKYGPEKKCLYNFWSLNSQNQGAFLRTFLVSNLSLSRISPLRNSTIGLVCCRRQPKIKPILLKVYVVVWVRIVLTESI